MKIHIYSIMWNEQFMLPYFLRHYDTFAERIFIINDHSTDKTVEIAKKNKKVTVLPFLYEQGLNEDDFNKTFAKYYRKYSRGKADWVMCVDADEFIYNKNVLDLLASQRQKGLRIIRTTGYVMLSKRVPRGSKQIYEECRHGVRIREFDKPVVFDPELDIEFTHGRHDIKPIKEARPVKGRLALLHFRYLSRSYFLDRTLETFARTPSLAKYKDYRIEKGLSFYDNNINKREKVI